MRSVFLFYVALLLCPYIQAQSLRYADKLYEYSPAPGQFINDPAYGTPQLAPGITNGIGNPLSLGAYGGYVILEFTEGVDNNPDNPYGIDFIVYGNAAPAHAEPGIIRVMNDENQNGIADEKWYEIAGSAHFTDDYTASYTIEYQNPKMPASSDVLWTDNHNNSGKIFKNSFHNQQYYPLNSLFPAISDESIEFAGSRISGDVKTNNGTFVSNPYAFGYADMNPVKNQTLTGLPDNPYTVGLIEGDGGDGIDISWAIDENGHYVDLQEINFIMIYTGVNASAGWLGEISSDIRGIVDVNPDKSIKAQQNMILADEIPQRIALTDSLQLSGRVFLSGRVAKDEAILWEAGNPDILKIENNQLVAIGEGSSLLKGFLPSDTSALYTQTISVVIPESLKINNEKGIIQKGENYVFSYSILDKSGEEVSGLIPEIIVENEDVAELTSIEKDKVIIRGKEAGTSLISLVFKGYPELSGNFELQVINKLDPIQITFSLGDNKQNIIPGNKYTVEKTEFENFIDRYQKSQRPEKPFITLADAIACVMKAEGFGEDGKSLAFRQDEFGGNGLYLWQVGYNWEYQYGWGGTDSDDSHAKTWFAIINDQVFASGFDTIEVYNGDRISLRHVEDNREVWNMVRIIPEKAEAEIDETVTFYTEQFDVFPSGSGIFSLSGPFPVVNGFVDVEQAVVNLNSDLVTSYSGEFNLSFNQAGRYEISVGNSAPVVMNVNFPLSSHVEDSKLNIWPNPCSDILNIRNPNGNLSEVNIYSLDGSLKIRRDFSFGSSLENIDVAGLKEGIYILEINSEGNRVRQKFCKL